MHHTNTATSPLSVSVVSPLQPDGRAVCWPEEMIKYWAGTRYHIRTCVGRCSWSVPKQWALERVPTC